MSLALEGSFGTIVYNSPSIPGRSSILGENLLSHQTTAEGLR